MKIALAVHDLSRLRGHDRYVAELCGQWKRAHEIHVVTSSVEAPNLTAGLAIHMVRVIRWPIVLKIATFALSAEAILRRLPVEVVHAQGFSCFSADVVTAHLCSAAYAGALRRFPTRDHGLLGQWYHRLTQPLLIALERRLYQSRRVKAIIAVSARLRDELVAHYGLDPRRIRVIYPGVNCEEFHPAHRATWRTEVRARHDIPSGRPVLLSIGPYARHRLDVVLRALVASPGAILLAIGGGWVGPYQALAQRLGVLDRVRFLSPDRETAPYFSASDLFLCLSVSDAFGLVIFEAMASGLPVIVSAQAGASELIVNGVEGVVLKDPDDPAEVVEAVQGLLGDPVRRQEMGRRARQKAGQYSWEVAARQTIHVLEEVAHGSGRR